MENDGSHSKAFAEPDVCGERFFIEMQEGLTPYVVNLDGLYWDSEENRYHMIELLRCKESQWRETETTPWESHPNKYWHLNRLKFLGQWAIALGFKVMPRYSLINYANTGTLWADRVRILDVEDVTPDRIKIGDIAVLDREGCREWFKELNRKAQRDLLNL